MALGDAFRRISNRPSFGLGATLDVEQFVPTQPGDPDFSLSTTPSSQAQFPAAAAERGIFENQRRGQNLITDILGAGGDPSAPEYEDINTVARQGFVPRALTLGEKLIGWIDGPRQAVNLFIQDMIGGVAEEGFRDPTIGDYWNALWGGVEDQEGFTLATGLSPVSGSTTLDMFGWSEEDDFGGRVARGIADFGLQVLTDPLSYVTFGLSALGKTVARATATKFMDDVVQRIVPRIKDGRLTASYMNELKEISPYSHNLLREAMDDTGEGFVSQFQRDMLDKIEQHGGTMPADIKAALQRRLGDENTWLENVMELAIANRVAKDVVQPLMSRDFANVNKLALEELPKFAHGGARISVPWTINTLSSGIVIPGTQGLGRRVLGDPLRKLSENLRKFGKYDDIADRVEEFKSLAAVERSVNKALATGSLKGWQYSLIRPGLDNIANVAGKETIIASINVLGKRVVEAASTAGIDDHSIIWSQVMHNLEEVDIVDDAALGIVDTILGSNLRGIKSLDDPDAAVADLNRMLAEGTPLKNAVDELTSYLRNVFDDYHAQLSKFDPDVKDRYIKGYAPHALTDFGKRIIGKLADRGEAISRSEWERLQAEGNPGGVLIAHLLASGGKGGRIETSLGGSRYFSGREEGRLAAVSLTDDGVVNLNKGFWEAISSAAAEMVGPGGVVNPTMQTKYAPASQLNQWMRPVVEKLAAENGIKLPKGWDGRVFSEDPLELAVGYIHNLDEVIRTWNFVDGLKAAGLAFRYEVAPNPEAIMQNMFRNVVRNTEEALVPAAPKAAPGMGVYYHGSRTSVPESLDALEKSSPYNLYGPGFYTTSHRSVASGYGDGGTTNAVRWQGDTPPKILNLDLNLRRAPEVKDALKVWLRTFSSALPDGFGGPQWEYIKDKFMRLERAIEGSDFESVAERTKLENSNLKIIFEMVRDLSYNSGLGDSYISLFNKLLVSHAGFDAMRHTGGLISGGRQLHDVVIWLQPEKLKVVDVSDLPEAVPGRVLAGYNPNLGPIRPHVSRDLKKLGFHAQDHMNAAAALRVAHGSLGEIQDILREVSREMHVGENFAPDLRDHLTLRGRLNLNDVIDGMYGEGEIDALFNLIDEFMRDSSRAWDLSAAATMRSALGVSDAGVDLVRDLFKRKYSEVSDNTLEYLSKEPAELFRTRLIADNFVEQMNDFFKAYAQVYDPDSGKLILDPKRVTLAGGTEFVLRLQGLRDAAKLADEAGWDTAVKIMNNVDDFMSLQQVKGFRNPADLGLGGPAVEGLLVQPEMLMVLRNFARNNAMMYTPEGIAALKMASNSVLRWWKAMATIARPTFHIRNHLSATWANMTVGVRPKDYNLVRNGAIVFKKALRDGLSPEDAIRKLPSEAQQYFKAAWDKDIMSGFVSSELRTLTAKQKAERLAWARMWDIDNFAVTRIGGRVMESIEDFHRMAAFVRWYDPKNPATADLAKAMVERVHFNYVTTTPLEDKLKSWIPFFVWTRRNLPLQISNMVENPRIIQRYRGMLQALDDNMSQDENGLPMGDQFTAYAAGTDYYVNPGTPFWARLIIDPEVPVRDLLSLPNPTPAELVQFGLDLVGPHLSTIANINEEREFDDVNAPAPLNAILRGLAFIGFFDTTTDGDVRIPYLMRTIAETAFPPSRELIDPIFGGPSDTNRQQRLGIHPDDNPLERALKGLGGTLARGFGVKMTSPVDARSVSARTEQELNDIVKELRLQGKLPPREEEGEGGVDLASVIFGG